MEFNIQNLKRAVNIVYNEPDFFFKQLKPIFYRTLTHLNLIRGGSKSFIINKVFLILTGKCNLKCRMCTLWGNSGICRTFPQWLKEDMTLSDWTSAVDGFASFSPDVIFFGGEPLLYPQWEELFTYVRKKGLRAHLPTNGTLLEEYADRLVYLLDNIDVSLDGPEDVHNEIRGGGEVFQKAISGIKRINSLKQKYRLKKPYVNVCCTIQEKNYLYLEELINSLLKEKVQINLLNFQHQEFTCDELTEKQKKFFKENFGQETNFWEGVKTIPPAIDIKSLFHQINKIRNKKYPGINYIEWEPDFNYKQLQEYYYREPDASPPVEKMCVAPYLESMILPSGDVWICPDYVIGNVKEDKLVNLWNNKRARFFRQKLQEIKTMPVCGSCYTAFMG